MNSIELYRKVKQYKREELKNSAIIDHPENVGVNIVYILKELREYNFTKRTEKDIDEWVKAAEIDTPHNECGIPMINTNDDW